MDDQHFWNCVDIGEESECWNWKGGKTPQGYGTYALPRHRHCDAHRYAYEQSSGQLLTRRTKVIHTCGNHACCNPAHLTVHTRPQVVPHSRNILTEKQVMCIHQLHDEGRLNQSELARWFGVHVTTVNAILKRRTWKHVEVEDEY